MDQIVGTAISHYRGISRTTRGVPASDGAGVKMTRLLGSTDFNGLDPFLMLDEFRSDEPRDYLAGFPDHPHRGFDTVTYMLAGSMRHKDNHGHEGVIKPGGLQWMRAGRGIIHSEMPEQEAGLMWGFQLWINLPGEMKMAPPAYQEFDKEDIPEEKHDDGTAIRVIAGTTVRGTTGPVKNIPTAPLYLDIALSEGGKIEQTIPVEASAFVYVYEGTAEVLAGEGAPVPLERGTLGIFGSGDGVHLRGATGGARLLLLAAQPIREPVAWAGPFVMNTRAEILQAFQDFHNGAF
jgi:redox-sensitive bicupin YhaK (pirin superfamily)